MEICLMPYGGVMGERHEVFTGDTDYELTAEECRKREFVQIDHYSDIDCFGLKICDATDEPEDSMQYVDREPLASVILSRYGALEFIRELLGACITEDGYWSHYAASEANEAWDRINYLCYLLRGEL